MSREAGLNLNAKKSYIESEEKKLKENTFLRQYNINFEDYKREINNKIYTFQELDALKTTVNFSRTLVNDPQCKNSIQYCFNTIKECNNENLINNEPCKTSLQFCKVLEENKLCNASEDEVQDALKTTSDEQMDKIIEAGKILQK